MSVTWLRKISGLGIALVVAGVLAGIGKPVDAYTLEPKRLPMIGKAGIEYFHGKWLPYGQNMAIVAGTMSIKPGRFTYERNLLDTDYRVVEEHPDYVVVFLKRNFLDGRKEYWFAFLYMVPDGDTAKYVKMQIDTCYWKTDSPRKVWNLTEDIFQLPLPELRRFYASHVPCNPALVDTPDGQKWGKDDPVKSSYDYIGKAD